MLIRNKEHVHKLAATRMRRTTWSNLRGGPLAVHAGLEEHMRGSSQFLRLDTRQLHEIYYDT